MPEAASASTPSAPASPSTANADYAKEFSKPVGKTDGEVWDRHFGKTAVEKDKSESKSQASSRSSTKSAAEPGSKAPPDASAKSTSDESSKSSAKDSKSATTKDAKSSTPTAPKSEKTESKSASSEAKQTKDEAGKPAKEGTAPASSKDPADGAPGGGKARELFEKAEAADDPGEARRLYKQAMREAFGKVPDAFREETYVAVRQERQRAKAEIEAARQRNEQRIAEAVEKLTPAANVMRKLSEAGLGQLTMPLIEKAVSVMRALKPLEDGDFTALAEVVSQATGVSHDEAMKRFVRGVKVSPEGSAARRAAENAQREAQEAKAQLAELQRQLHAQAEERKREQTEAEKRAAVEQTRTEWLERIESDLDGHPALKLPRGKERVLAYLIKTADPKLRAPKYSFEQAADRIVAYEKRRLADAKRALGEETGDPESEPEQKTETRSRGARTVPRSERADAGVKDESPEASFDRIYRKYQGGRKR